MKKIDVRSHYKKRDERSHQTNNRLMKDLEKKGEKLMSDFKKSIKVNVHSQKLVKVNSQFGPNVICIGCPAQLIRANVQVLFFVPVSNLHPHRITAATVQSLGLHTHLSLRMKFYKYQYHKK